MADLGAIGNDAGYVELSNSILEVDSRLAGVGLGVIRVSAVSDSPLDGLNLSLDISTILAGIAGGSGSPGGGDPPESGGTHGHGSAG